MGYYSDPTGNAACGRLDHEMQQIKKEAEHLAQLQQTGKLTCEHILSARRRFTGIYRPILKKAIGF